jgi:hypothetical protein
MFHIIKFINMSKNTVKTDEELLQAVKKYDGQLVEYATIMDEYDCEKFNKAVNKYFLVWIDFTENKDCDHCIKKASYKLNDDEYLCFNHAQLAQNKNT